MKELKNKALKTYVEKILEMMGSGKNPFEMPWRTAFNPTTNREYQGLNNLILALEQNEDPRYMTYLQAQSEGLQVRRGEKGIPLQYFSYYDKEKKQTVTAREARDPERMEHIIPIRKSFTVFNAKQIEGMEPLKQQHEKTPTEVEVKAFIERAMDSMGVKLVRGGQQAFYQRVFDQITVPSELSFTSHKGELSVLLHELSHATGHEKRLNRFSSISKRDEKDYAKEELVAEISTLLLKKELGIDEVMPDSNSIAYLQSWHDQIKDNPAYLFEAIKEAEKSSEYLLEKGLEREIDRKIDIVYDHRPTVKESVEAVMETATNDQELMLSLDQMTPSKHTLAQYKVLYGEKELSDEIVMETTRDPYSQNAEVGYRARTLMRDNPLSKYVDIVMLGNDIVRRSQAIRSREKGKDYEIES